jgi:hypothetical protein
LLAAFILTANISPLSDYRRFYGKVSCKREKSFDKKAASSKNRLAA